MRKQFFFILIRNYNNKIINVIKYIVIKLYFSEIIDNKIIFILIKMQMKIYLIKNLKINMLFDIDIFTSYQFVLDNTTQFININNYQNIKILIRFIITSYSQIKRIVKTKTTITLPPNTIINILINYHNILFDDRNFLFKLELFIDFDYEKEIFIHVVNILIIFVQTKNVIATFIILFRNIKLNTMMKYTINNYYQFFYKSTDLTTCK